MRRAHSRLPRLAVLAATAILAGCSAKQRVDTSGPPPDGYSSWDEYFEAEDQLQMATEATRRSGAIGRGVPGVTVNR